MNSCSFLCASAVSLMALFCSNSTRAHCDTLNGPVVSDVRASIAAADVTPLLKWLQPRDEPEIRALFTKTLSARKQSPAAAELLDRHLFETVVRLHRAGEGEPFTGLQPGDAIQPGVRAADAAIASGNVAALTAELQDRIAAELERRFQRVMAAKAQQAKSIEAGRAYVAEYVGFFHFAEQVFGLLEHSRTTAHAAAAHVGEAQAAEKSPSHDVAH